MPLRPPTSDPFWGSIPLDLDGGARLFLFGAPLEYTVSGAPGTAAGPAAVRAASQNIESYSPIQDVDLFDLKSNGSGLADLGDLDFAGLDLEAALAEIEQATEQILARRGVPVMIGGEHTGTLAAFRAVKQRYRDAAIISLDAHLDLADELDGRRLAHGTWAARLGDEWGYDCLILLGVRSGTRAEWQRSLECAWRSPELALALTDDVYAWLRNRPIYLSIDIDVLDPAGAPGTGVPEPGGPTSRELFDFLYSLRQMNVVGLDVMEVLPGVDPAGITAALAAKLVREAAILFRHLPTPTAPALGA